MKDFFTKEWIIRNSVEICDQYEKGVLTLRALHYQLVSRGMTNDIQHYKRVVIAMIAARWEGQIDFDMFSDLDRAMVGETCFRETILSDEINNAQDQVMAWMTNYHKNKWENQPYYPEVFIEKKALQGVFESVCRNWNVALGACKGYPSLTFLHEAVQRFINAEIDGKELIIIYFGDYDPSGEDIPRSIHDNMQRFGVDVEVKRIALMKSQVLEWNLPPAPAKISDTRTAKWDGIGQVELDAVKPEKLIEMCEDSISEIFDQNLYQKLLDIEHSECVKYRSELKNFVNGLKD